MTIQEFVSQLIDSIRSVNNLTYDQMAYALSEDVDRIDPSTIFRWRERLTRLDTLAGLIRAYPAGDWRGDFARAILTFALYGEHYASTPIRIEFEQAGDSLPVAG